MVFVLRKKGFFIVAIVVVVSAAFFFLKWYCGDCGVPVPCGVNSVAEARIRPGKTPLSFTRRLLGAQVLVFNSRSYKEVENAISELKKAGVNTIIVRAFQNRGDRMYRFAQPRCKVGAYFETSHAPVVDPVLTRLVSMGHGLGLKVFAWMETRKMPLRLADPEGSKALAYCFETDSLKPVDMWSIFDEDVERALVALYKDVVRSGVDGILIQDDLIMYQDEDFSSKGVDLFRTETGKELDPKILYDGVFQDGHGHWCVPHYSDTFWAWAWWKNQKLLELADTLVQAAKSINPGIQVAMNFMYESVTDPKNALAWLSQSLAEATKLPIDYFAIMAYHRQMRQELRLSEVGAYKKVSRMTARLLELMDDPYRILMKVQMTDWKTRKEISPYEADQVFERINSQGRVSLAFIPYSPTVPLHVIGQHFR